MSASSLDIPLNTDILLDRLSTAVLSLDRQCRIILLNSAAEALFRISARQSRARPVNEAVPSLHPIMERVKQSLDSKMGCTEREFELARPGFAPVIVDITITPLDPPCNQQAVIVEFFSFDRPLKISRKAQARAQERANREVIRGLAHEIKNPLGGLRGAAQLLGRELRDPELVAYTHVVIREADRLRNLVDRLLEPNTPLVKQAVNVHRLLEHVYKLVSGDLPAGIVLTRDYDPSLPELPADEEQLVQALLNVVRNAVEAVSSSPSGGGHVVLRSRAQRQYTISDTRYRLVARIDVVDDGPGFDEALRERIFYPLVTTRASGSGLGLSISRHVVHSHGGAMDCASRPGETLFSIYLPLEPEDKP